MASSSNSNNQMFSPPEISSYTSDISPDIVLPTPHNRQTARQYRESLRRTRPIADFQRPSVRVFKFRSYSLFSFNHNTFKVPLHLYLDKSQHVLLDNLWNSQTMEHRNECLLTLSQYFASIQKKLLSKNFSHYVVRNGFQIGVFFHWASVKWAIDGFEWPIYKGFYSLEEATEYAREHIGHNFAIEENPESSLHYANQILEKQIQDVEVTKVKEANKKLFEKIQERGGDFWSTSPTSAKEWRNRATGKKNSWTGVHSGKVLKERNS